MELGRLFDDLDEAPFDQRVQSSARHVERVERVDISATARFSERGKQSLLIHIELRPAGGLS